MAANFKLLLARLCFPHLFVPTAFEGDGGDDDDEGGKGDKKKYSANLLIKKTNKPMVLLLRQELKRAEKEALADPKKWAGKAPKDWEKTVLRDGDEKFDDDPEKYAAYKGHWYVNAKSKRKPQCVKKDDGELSVITDPDDIYPGCYVNATINFYGFTYKNKKGMACGLGNVLFSKDGERLGNGGSSAEDDFADELGSDDEDDDFL